MKTISEAWDEYRARQRQKKVAAVHQWARSQADTRFNIVNIGHNVVTFDGVVVSLENDDDTHICERLKHLREMYVDKLVSESGL